jgi:hypothetical protein
MTPRLQHCPLCKSKEKFDFTEYNHHVTYDCKGVRK